MFDELCNWLEKQWGGKHYFTTNALGHKLLYVENGSDIFYINLTDKSRFGVYTVYHHSHYGQGFHVQEKKNDLFIVLCDMYSHNACKCRHIPWVREDRIRIRQDWKNFCNFSKNIV